MFVTKSSVNSKASTNVYESKTSSSEERVNTQMFTMPYENATLIRKQDVIYEVVKKLCPYSDYCQRKKESQLNYKMVPCCANCSCENSCWETGNCCPDKVYIGVQKPIRHCRVTIVKTGKGQATYDGINYGILAYYIVDYCPPFEQNASIINKCTLSHIDHINDYRWVSDSATGYIYQNKFCAACHGKNRLTEWRLETRCKNLLFSNFSHMNSLLLSRECDIINREPVTETNNLYERCAIPSYFRCNQTGLWANYDPYINWACDMYSSAFLEKKHRNFIVYKNAFCFACNLPGIENAPTVCSNGPLQEGHLIVFNALIDYKRNERLSSDLPSSNMSCKVNEIMDQYMQKCRPLICAFAHTPHYGQCEQLVEETHGLSVEVIFLLSVSWSKVDYNPTNYEDISSRRITTEIFHELHRMYALNKSGISCPVCYQGLRANLNQSISTNLIYRIILYTEKECQVPQLLENSLKLVWSTVEIKPFGELIMVLQVELVKENIQSLISRTKIIDYIQNDNGCFVTFKMTTEKTCPRIRISVSEFEIFMKENHGGTINDLFTAPQSSSEDYEEICVHEYFAKLNHSKVHLTSAGFHTESFSFMSMIGIAQQLS